MSPVPSLSVTLANKQRVISFPILCPLVFLLSLLSLFFLMYGALLRILLDGRNTMLALSMTSANLPGFIFTGLNLKFFRNSLNSKSSSYADRLGRGVSKASSFPTQIGVTHYVSCPHAHQQNGPAERKHRHIVKVALALLTHVSMPLKFWDEAAATTAYLIN
jgi:hypothetical protein